MNDNRKLAVSVRMPLPDVRKVKALAERLGTRDSEVIRFAVKTMLARLGPLYDCEVRGRNLVPAFVESGSELLRFFDLDAARLEAIINDRVEPARRVDHEDIALLALTNAQQPYAALRLSQLNSEAGAGGVTITQTLRDYLYEKYVYRNEPAGGAAATEPGAPMRVAGAQP